MRLVLGLGVAERRDAVAWLSASVFGDEDFLVAVGEFGDGGAEGHVCVSELATSNTVTVSTIYVGIRRRTDSGADVARAEGLDGEVWVDLADDLGGIAVGEVRVLIECQ